MAREKEAALAKQDAEEEISWKACARRLEQLHADREQSHMLQRAVDEGYAQVPIVQRQVITRREMGLIASLKHSDEAVNHQLDSKP